MVRALDGWMKEKRRKEAGVRWMDGLMGRTIPTERLIPDGGESGGEGKRRTTFTTGGKTKGRKIEMEEERE